MLARTGTVFLLALAACHPAEGSRPESKSTLVGRLMFHGDRPAAERGSVRLVLRVRGEIDDACRRTHRGELVATYAGELVLARDNGFSAQLYPNPMVTADGCAVAHVHVERVTSIEIDAQVADRSGNGWLTFQTLAAVDDRELRTGAFGELVAEIVFQPPPPPPTD